MLQKMAYTGIAASLIEGKTTHSAASISKQVLRGMSDAKKAKMEAEWRNVEYIIIDEVSMIDREFFAVMSKNISIAKKSQTPDSIHAPFGGISVILCGDFHQFPPVIKGVPGALFQPNVATPAVTKPKKSKTKPLQPKTETQVKKDLMSQTGREIYERFTTVVLLTEQMRVSDPIWRALLQRMRRGQTAEQDFDTLRSLIITRPECPPQISTLSRGKMLILSHQDTPYVKAETTSVQRG